MAGRHIPHWVISQESPSMKDSAQLLQWSLALNFGAVSLQELPQLQTASSPKVTPALGCPHSKAGGCSSQAISI